MTHYYILSAVESGTPEDVKMAVELGDDIEATELGGLTMLEWAAENGRTEIVRVLLDLGAKNIVEAIFWAARSAVPDKSNELNQCKVIDLLISEAQVRMQKPWNILLPEVLEYARMGPDLGYKYSESFQTRHACSFLTSLE